MPEQYTVSNYLIDRLLDIGVQHAFGVPADYVLDFLDHVVTSELRWVGTCNELNAGYAADGYARLNGAGAAVVTYGVGGLSILNALAGAYAEQVPLIVVSGAPPGRRREAGAMVHHLVSGYYLQLDVCKQVTADAAILTDAGTAPAIVDRVLMAAITQKLPAYLELPLDVALSPCARPGRLPELTPVVSDRESLEECVAEVVALVDAAEHPLVLAGVDLLRFGLGEDALALIETTEMPFATMLSSKSVLPELHPQFVGIYQGGWSRDAVREEVEAADCVLSLGVRSTDLDTGLFSAVLDGPRVISAAGGEVRIGRHYYRGVELGDLMRGLAAAVKPRSYLSSHPASGDRFARPFVPASRTPLTAVRLYEALDDFLDDDMVLLAEPGDAFCAAAEFHIEEAENFVVQGYYCSIGYCTPAALGVALARPRKRPVVLTGDGAFQMTAQEVSTMVRMRVPALIVLVNNDGYLVERKLHEDGLYNDIQMALRRAAGGVRRPRVRRRLPGADGGGARGGLRHRRVQPRQAGADRGRHPRTRLLGRAGAAGPGVPGGAAEEVRGAGADQRRRRARQAGAGRTRPLIRRASAPSPRSRCARGASGSARPPARP